MTLLVVLATAALGGLLARMALGYPALPTRPTRPARAGLLDRRQRWLRQAGANVTVAQFAGVSVACAATAGLVVMAATGVWAIALAPTALAALAPHAYWSARRRRHVAEVRQAWPDGLRDLAASVNARLPLHEALAELAARGPQPLRRAFAAYPGNARVMGSIAALEHVRAQLADPTSDRVIEVLVLAAERRPARLAGILEDFARSVTADLRVEEVIRTARIEPHINTAVAAVVPWLLLAMVTAADTPHRAYYTTGRGLAVVLIAAAMTLAGVVVSRLLARDPVEGRIFTGEQAR